MEIGVRQSCAELQLHLKESWHMPLPMGTYNLEASHEHWVSHKNCIVWIRHFHCVWRHRMTFKLAELSTGWLLTNLNSLLDEFWNFYWTTFNLTELSKDDMAAQLGWLLYKGDFTIRVSRSCIITCSWYSYYSSLVLNWILLHH